jgi:DHA1 family bicyclomycin/chloramphenicol resistance-like MFS transporter
MALFLAWLFLKESLPSPKRWLWQEVWNDYLFVFRSRKAWHLGMIPILMYSALLVYLVNFPLAISLSLMDIRAIGYLQAYIMLNFVLGSIIASYLIPRLNFRVIAKIAYLLACGGSLLLLLGSYMVPQSWNILTLFMGLVAAGSAFIIGVYMGESLNVFPEMRGISTAFQGALRLSFSSLMIFLSGFLINHHFSYVILLICLCIFGSLCLSLINKEAPERS